MCTALNSFALTLAILVSCPESETAIVTGFTTQPSSPSSVGEGQNLTLVWTYTLDGTVGLAQFSIVPGNSNGTELAIGRRFGPGVLTVKPEYQARFRAQATNTRAELSIIAVQRSDQTTYRMNVVPSGTGGLVQLVVVIVNYRPSIIEISGNQTVIEGGNVTLNCLAVGKPTPNIAWTKLSDNSAVSGPLTEIRRQEAGKYRCIADNRIGNPAFGDIWIDVQYPPEATGFGKNATMPEGGEETFSCPVDGNPKPNILWYKGSEVSGMPIISGEKLKARVSGCYTCVASNYLGTSSNITQCLTVTVDAATVTAFTTNASSLSYIVEGQNLTLVWTYTLDGTVGLAQFSIITNNGTELAIGRRFGHGIVTVKPEYQARFRAQATNTRAELSIIAVQRSDQTTYRMNVVPSGTGGLVQLVVVIVNYPVEVTGSGENATVAGGGSKTFTCPVDANPEPKIEWYNEKTGSKISSEKQLEARESGCYTCVASNSLGTSVNITHCLTIFYESSTTVPSTMVSEGEC